jgi:hypothetical protein
MTKDIDKIDLQLKKDRLIEKNLETHSDGDRNDDKYDYLGNKITKQNKNLKKAEKMGKEIENTQNLTYEELRRQRERLQHTNGVVTEVEETLSLHDQLFGVMNNRELYNKLKLVVVIALLFLADILVLWIKVLK